MLRQDDQNAIEDLFERLRNAERNSGPRDEEAERLIRQRLQDNPAAAYYMAQTIIVQEAALREQQHKIEELEQNSERGSGFLGGIFGGERPHTPQRATTPVQREADPGPWGRPRRDTGFLAGAAQTALGVTGGLLLGSAVMGMFNTPANAEEAATPEPAQEPVPDEGGDAGDAGGDDWGGDFDIGGDF